MVRRFYVTYDLRGPGQNYLGLYTRLTELGGERLLESVWILVGEYTDTAVELRNHLLNYIDRNDRLLVVQGDAAWWNLAADPATVNNVG